MWVLGKKISHGSPDTTASMPVNDLELAETVNNSLVDSLPNGFQRILNPHAMQVNFMFQRIPCAYVDPAPGFCLARFLDRAQFSKGKQPFLVIQHDTGFSPVDLDNLTDTTHPVDLDPVAGPDIVGLVFTTVHIQVNPPFPQGINITAL